MAISFYMLTNLFSMSCSSETHIGCHQLSHASCLITPTLLSVLPKVSTILDTCESEIDYSFRKIQPDWRYIDLTSVDVNTLSRLKFSANESGQMHGFAGYFDTVLYKDVILSLSLLG